MSDNNLEIMFLILLLLLLLILLLCLLLPYSKAVVYGFTAAAVISAHVATAAFVVPRVVTDVDAIRAIVVAVAMVLPMLV